MKKRLFLSLTILAFISNLTNCQNRPSTDLKFLISDVFMKIPFESLTNANKEELLKNKRIDSISDNIYATLDINLVKNNLFIQSCFYECSSCPCTNHSIYSYRITDSTYIIGHSSNISSIPGDGHMAKIQFYQYNAKSKTLVIDSESFKVFPKFKDFFLADTPKSVFEEFSEKGVDVIYNLDDEKIICEIPNADRWQLIVDPFGLFKSQWFKCNRIEMKWNGNTFVQGKIIRAEIEKNGND